MAVNMIFQKFKENCNIDNAIFDYTRKKKFSIHIYCLEKDMNIKK